MSKTVELEIEGSGGGGGGGGGVVQKSEATVVVVDTSEISHIMESILRIMLL